MMTATFDRTIEGIQEEIQIDDFGRGKASIRATARLAGVSHVALIKAFEGGNLNPSGLAVKLILNGFESGNLQLFATDGIPDIAISIILEYYAFDAGRYCNEQAKNAYKAFATIGIRTWMQRLKGWQELNFQPNSQPKEAKNVQQQPSVKDISEAISSVFCMGTIDPNLVQGLIANEISKAHPQLQSQMEAVKQFLPIPVKDELVTVTNLAKLYAERMGKSLNHNGSNWSSARVMNEILIAKGMQIKNPNSDAKKSGQPLYLPTDKGKQHSKVILQEAKGSNKTIQQLRWFPSVLSVIN
jgi:hypothetical protein